MSLFGKAIKFAKPFTDWAGDSKGAGVYRIASFTPTNISLVNLRSDCGNHTATLLVKLSHLRKTAAPKLHSASIQTIARLPAGLLTKTMKELFRKNNRLDMFDESVNFDNVFYGLAKKYLGRYKNVFSPDDVDDVILEVLLQVVTPKTIKEYDGSRSIVSYFGGMFAARLISAARNKMSRRKYEHDINIDPSSTQTMEEYLDMVDSRVRDNDPVDIMSFKDMMESLTKYLSKQPEAKYYLALLQALFEGKSNTEVAKELGVSVGIMTKYFNRLKEAILKYAAEVKDEDLFDLMSKYMNQRRGSLDMGNGMFLAFAAYRNHKCAVHTAKRERAAKMVKRERAAKIVATPLVDPTNAEFLASILDAEDPSNTLASYLEQFQEAASESEILEADDGQLIALMNQ